MCEPRRGGLGIDLLTVFGRNQPWWSETSSLPNWETEPFCCFSATQFVVPRDGSSRKLKWAKSACFELKNNHLLWNPIFIILYLSDLGQVHLTSLCFTFLPWNGESGTNLPGTLWQMMLLSAWRVQGERDDLVNAGGGRREPAGYVVGGGSVSVPLLISSHPLLTSSVPSPRPCLHRSAFPCLPKCTSCLFHLSFVFVPHLLQFWAPSQLLPGPPLESLKASLSDSFLSQMFSKALQIFLSHPTFFPPSCWRKLFQESVLKQLPRSWFCKCLLWCLSALFFLAWPGQ